MDGKTIAQRRKEKGLTQDALGALLGISGKAVSKWERGLAKPDKAHSTKLCELLGLPLELQEKKSEHNAPTFLSLLKNEFLRVFATAVILASCICYLLGILPLDSTVVSIGFSTALFFFGTMIAMVKSPKTS